MFKPTVSLFILQLFMLSSMVSGRRMAHENRLEKTSCSEETKDPPETKVPNKHSSSSIRGKTDKHNEVQIKALSSKKTERKFLLEEKEDEAGACRRVPMHVSSSDLENSTLFDGIVAPMRFNAFKCVGKCKSGKPTNYSLMMAILNSKNEGYSTDGSRSCCVPIKWRPFSFLILHNDEVLLRKFDNMIVQECGCI
ncbi:bone morphogenetic protein 2-A-like isoform X2 [Stylophora pistillata]|uniref:bone morphogenetic protein 2-A-like isoform X2 n=1 Tax=Stylophora pistillata TaxID=50429 RepID=UPI000C047DDE|nr:bone morphogenetic protein 2-A-like isoform X2 [Stylophora pistillata]